MSRAILALSAVLALAVSSAAGQPTSVVEAALATPDLSILVEAVQAADPSVLKLLSDRNFDGTVFAPTNAAFARLLNDLHVTKRQLLRNKALLTEVLLYHVFPSAPILSKDLTLRQYIQTLVRGRKGVLKLIKVFKRGEGTVVRAFTTSGGTSKVVIPDVRAGKAVVHVVNRVLVPGNKVRWPRAKVIR